MKKNNPLKIILIIIIFIFLCSYYISNSGYYEYELKQRTILTNEKIKEFESDLKSNKNIDIKNYLNPEESNYSNKITNLAYNLSNKGNHLMRKCIESIFKKLSELITSE